MNKITKTKPRLTISFGRSELNDLIETDTCGLQLRASDLTPDVVGVLKQMEEPLMAWISENEANIRRFVANPMAALEEAGCDLELLELPFFQRLRDHWNRRVVESDQTRLEMDVKADLPMSIPATKDRTRSQVKAKAPQNSLRTARYYDVEPKQFSVQSKKGT